MKDKLLPCPWCGSEPIVRLDHKGTIYEEWIVECDSHYCPCQPTAHDTYFAKEEAIEAWNTRV